jgi:WD40 repeat protein
MIIYNYHIQKRLKALISALSALLLIINPISYTISEPKIKPTTITIELDQNWIQNKHADQALSDLVEFFKDRDITLVSKNTGALISEIPAHAQKAIKQKKGCPKIRLDAIHNMTNKMNTVTFFDTTTGNYKTEFTLKPHESVYFDATTNPLYLPPCVSSLKKFPDNYIELSNTSLSEPVFFMRYAHALLIEKNPAPAKAYLTDNLVRVFKRYPELKPDQNILVIAEDTDKKPTILPKIYINQ